MGVVVWDLDGLVGVLVLGLEVGAIVTEDEVGFSHGGCYYFVGVLLLWVVDFVIGAGEVGQ